VSPAVLSPPSRRADLRIEPFGDGGRHVVKDPRTGGYYLLDEQEHFLLLQLDGQRDAVAVREAFEERFREPLGETDLDDFLETAREQGMLAPDATHALPVPPKPKQHLLAWRKSLVDPDRFFTWLEPRIRFVWTKGFVAASVAAVLLASCVLWSERDHLVTSVRDSLRWDTVALSWVVLCGLGGLHECAHGLTCKHHGGEVREVGVLLLFFAPCFYCNVSDAWLFQERRKRVAVMAAGVAFDLVVWAMAVFAWRVTEPDNVVHHAAFLVLMLTGVETLFNLNPLIQLDGYYLLGDVVEVPNLRRRALERAGAHAKRLLWGGPRPAPERRARFLTGFGFASWFFSATFLVLMGAVVATWLHDQVGLAGYVVAAALWVPAAIGLFRGLFGEEFKTMITKKHVRKAIWLLVLGGIAWALVAVEVDEYSGGAFTVRPTAREEVRAPVAGFLRSIAVDESDRVEPGTAVACLEVPDLESAIDKAKGELREAEAQRRLLQAGAKPVEVEEQERRVERAAAWHEEAKASLEKMRKALAEEVAAFGIKRSEADLQRKSADAEFARREQLAAARAVSGEEAERADTARQVARLRITQLETEQRAREALGTVVAEEEVAKRAKELADERARLSVLKAGPRPEEVDVAHARVDRLRAEIAQLEKTQARTEVRCRVAGRVVTPHLRERVGQFLQRGDLICAIEDADGAEAEVGLDEQKIRGVAVGQTVRFKARALPYDTLEGKVLGIAPAAGREEPGSRGTILVRCSVPRAGEVLRSSMGGYARIYTGRRSVGGVVLDWGMRFFRTEFWW
jgi:multidrug resistance efflux pump